MSYNLNRLGSQNFEHLVQALSKKIIGEGVSIYGAGPDGQRESTFHGKAPYPSETECWEGYWVIQAKFKEPNTKKADFPWIEKLNEYLKLLLDFSHNDSEYNIWQNHIRTLAFLGLGKKEWFKYPDMLFPEPRNKRPRKYPSYFAEKDTETIIKNMVSYVSWSENMSALEFLIEFILSEMTYEMFVKIDWNSLKDVSSIKTQCLLALSNINKEEDVEEKLLSLLSDDNANEFVFKLATSMRLPERFLPLYIYYLNKFRQENNTQYVFDLEKTIVSYINIIPVDLEDFKIE